MAKFNEFLRISNTDIKGNKQIRIALTAIKGVGRVLANAACQVTKINKTKKAGDLSDKEITQLEEFVNNPKKFNIPSWLMNRRNDPETGEDKHLIMSDLRFSKEQDIKKLQKMKTYRGLRHAQGLTVRGQRTQGNFRKNKGKSGIKVKKLSTNKNSGRV